MVSESTDTTSLIRRQARYGASVTTVTPVIEINWRKRGSEQRRVRGYFVARGRYRESAFHIPGAVA